MHLTVIMSFLIKRKDSTSGQTINMLRREVETLKEQLGHIQAEKRQADRDLASIRKEYGQIEVTVGNVQ